MLQECAYLNAGEWSGEPLHVVFHEHLNRGAPNGTAALDGRMDAPVNRHVGAEENLRIARAMGSLCHFERSGSGVEKSLDISELRTAREYREITLLASAPIMKPLLSLPQSGMAPPLRLAALAQGKL